MAVGHFSGRSRHEDELARNDGGRHDGHCPDRGRDALLGAAGIELDHPRRRCSLASGIHDDAAASPTFQKPGGTINDLRQADLFGEELEFVDVEV